MKSISTVGVSTIKGNHFQLLICLFPLKCENPMFLSHLNSGNQSCYYVYWKDEQTWGHTAVKE